MKCTDPPHNIPSEIRDISCLIDQGQYHKALKAMEVYIDKFPNDRAVNFFTSSIFVDIGFRLRDQGLVLRGIEAAETIVIDSTYKQYWPSTHYNLSNAYIDLFLMSELRSGPNSSIKLETIPTSDSLQRAKMHIRNVISITDDLSHDFNKQLWVNYGNCLDTTGRSVEAFYAYDRALQYDNKFSMAIGNKAIASMKFAEISGRYSKSIRAQAYHAIKSIIDDPELIKKGGPDARSKFEKQLLRIETIFKDEADFLANPSEHPLYDMTGLSPFECFYIDYCRREKLFLNFHIHNDQCEAALSDPIFIRSLINPKEDDPFATPYKFAKYINQIKEDFAIARLLLVQSQFKRDDFDNISRKTTLINCLDYSLFNLYIGILKSAFKEAYDILDKIAVFINDYYYLGLPERKVYFKSIWHQEGKIREKIENSKNISLYALYDIFLDFKTGYHDNIKNTRDALIHRKLVVYDTRIISCEIIDTRHEMGYDTLLETTNDLMRLVKAAIVYLINFVNIEESKKLRDGDGEFTIPFDTNQNL